MFQYENILGFENFRIKRFKRKFLENETQWKKTEELKDFFV